MGFANSVYVLILVLSVVIISVHNSDIREYTRCLERISQIKGININSNGSKAFEYLFHNINPVYKNILKKGITNNYVMELLKKVIPVFQNSNILSPLQWCVKNISSLFEPSNMLDDDLNCYNFLVEAGFKYISDVINSFTYGYLNVVLTNDTNDVLNRYYIYVFINIQQFLDNISLPGPKEYCVEYSVSMCINRIITNGGMNSDFNATQAFNHIYLNINFLNIKKLLKDKIIDYTDYLFEKATWDLKQHTINIFESPMAWCVQKLSNESTTIKADITMKCYVEMKEIFYNNKMSAFFSLYQGYYNLDINSEMNELTKEYYFYIITKFLPYVEKSGAQSIKGYCTILHQSIKTESDHGKSHNLHSIDQQQPDYSDDVRIDLENNPYNSQLSMAKANTYFDGQSSTFNFTTDQYQADQNEYWPFNTSSEFTSHADNSLVPDQQQYLHSNLSSASMSAGIDYSANNNDLNSVQNQGAVRNSELFINTPDVIVFPTLFVSPSNEDELNYHNYKPTFNG